MGFRWRRPKGKTPAAPKKSVRHYERLQDIGEVCTVIDVGIGDQGSPFLYDAFPSAYYYAIDPVAETLPVMHSFDVDGVLIPVACGNRNGEIKFGISAKMSRTSLVGRLTADAKSHPVVDRVAPIVRLEDLAIETMMNLRRPCLLKVDVEGFELQVLDGVGRLWQEIDYVVIEISFGWQYNEQVLPSAIFGALAQNGFQVAGIMKCGHDTSDLLFSRQCDTGRNF